MRACVIPLLMLAFATACNDGSPGRTAQANAGPPDGGADAGIDATDQDADVADVDTADDAGGDTPPDAGTDPGADATPEVGPDAAPDIVETWDVVLNEIHCQGPDFIELYNPGARSVALDGFVLTDDPADPERGYVFGPVDIGRGDFVTVHRDEDGGDGFGFGIRCGEDTVELLSPGGAVVDSLEVPVPPAAPVTLCRLPDGEEAWTYCDPTPGEPNVALDVRTADDWFASFEVRRLDVTVPRESWRSLEVNPKTYVEASLSMESEGIGPLTIAIRLKGQIGSFRGLDDKPAFKIDINRYVEGQLFFGMEKLTLNNMVQDRSLVHEYGAYALFRAMGVPAPRVTYVDLYIDGEPFGLYLSVEGFDDVGLARWFDSTTHLYEGEYGQDLLSGDVDEFEIDEGDPDDRSDLREMAELLERLGVESFYAATADTVDWNEVVRMMATEFWIGHWDGYAPTRNNYFFHFDGDGILTLLPWGTDQTFRQYLDFTNGRGLLLEACLADIDCVAAYLEALVEVGTHVESLGLIDTLIEVEEAIRTTAELDPRRWYSMEVHAAWFAETIEFIETPPGSVGGQRACFVGPVSDPDGDGAPCHLDCAADDPAIHPGAEEICGDGIDQDCSGHADDDPTCPDCEETPVDGLANRYWFCPMPRTFEEGAAICDTVGAAMVQIETEGENTAVYEAAIAARDDYWWLGLTDLASEGVWRWMDGSPLTYENWYEGEPNNWRDEEDCASFWVGPAWNDIRCNIEYGTICEAAPL